MKALKIINREAIILFMWGKWSAQDSEVLIDRYVIVQKLGWGHFSTVWLARDFKYGTYVAIKVQKSASHYLEAAYDEVELLQKAAKMSTSEAWKERLKQIYGVDFDYQEKFHSPVHKRRLSCSPTLECIYL